MSFTHIYVWNNLSLSSSSTSIKFVRVIEEDGSRVIALELYSMIALPLFSVWCVVGYV
jgi:hypothetical protein